LSRLTVVIVFNGVYHSTHLNHLSFSLYTSEVQLAPLKLLYFTVISDLKFVLSLYEFDFIRSMYLRIMKVLEKTFFNIFF